MVRADPPSRGCSPAHVVQVLVIRYSVTYDVSTSQSRCGRRRGRDGRATHPDRGARRDAGGRSGGRCPSDDADGCRSPRRCQPDDAVPARAGRHDADPRGDDAGVRRADGRRGAARPPSPQRSCQGGRRHCRARTTAAGGAAVPAGRRRRPRAVAAVPDRPVGRDPAARPRARPQVARRRCGRWVHPPCRSRRARRDRPVRDDAVRGLGAAARRRTTRVGPRRAEPHARLLARRVTAAVTAARRSRELAAMRSGAPIDLLVVGGGITGAGVALDAATRGLRVVLVERGDLASGTSRWSSKLAHGGLRYIAAGQLGVAWESAVERNRLFRHIAPHLVQPMRFVIPRPPAGRRADRIAGRIGFGIADAMRAASRTPAVLPRTRWIDDVQIRTLLPALRGSREAALHVDGSLEDDARLVVGIARTAASYGATILTHCRAESVHARGAHIVNVLTGESQEVAARCVVVAAGVWSGELVMDVPLQPSKGAHVLLRGDALGSPTSAFNILVPGSHNRYVFAVPRPDGTVQVGLTDDAVDTVEDEPQATAQDEHFLLETLSSGLSEAVTSDDVVGRFAGLRPLLGGADNSNPADLSRRHALLDRDGVLVLVGGKLTTYRAMAEDAVDRVARQVDTRAPCITRTLPLVGATGACSVSDLPPRLVRRFGAEAPEVAKCGPLEPVAAGVPALKCEVGWAVAVEGAVTVADVERRLRLDLVPAWRDAARGYVEEVVSRSSG